ncbi:hypothetical protein HNV12_01270 [Methanococcoides sp. SA1]|nr:hypothetical protein [Methanococcoides sp. SA1]
MKRPTRAVDLDGPVYDMNNPFDAIMAAEGFPLQNPGLYTLNTRYGLKEGDPRGREILEYFINERRAFRDIPLKPRAIEALEIFNETGDHYIITARAFSPRAIRDTKERLLDECPFLIEGQIFIEPEKGKYADILEVTDFYEDWMVNGQDILEKSSSHLHVIADPHNRLSKHQEIVKKHKPRITRHASLYEAANSILH